MTSSFRATFSEKQMFVIRLPSFCIHLNYMVNRTTNTQQHLLNAVLGIGMFVAPKCFPLDNCGPHGKEFGPDGSFSEISQNVLNIHVVYFMLTGGSVIRR
ncbi:hypothetical protein ILYODFUR_020324 [Ilyodon furcidens]|uniref:Uncharacterized protein n=1 Tax=Ilyodon furcidens TaxID=33524 RepID=A0ABV0UJ51_9TELE